MRISDTNYIDSATTLIASNENSLYPISLVQDQRLGNQFRSTTTSVTITLTEASIVSAPVVVAIMGHNLTEDATITFQLDQHSDFSTATSETLIWNEDMILKFIDKTALVPTVELLDESSGELLDESGGTLLVDYNYTWHRFVISDATNPDGYISIGRLWIGEYWSITPSSLLDFKITYTTSDINIYGKDRQKFALAGVVWRKFELSFPPTDNTMISTLNDFIDRVGNHSSFIFCNFDDLTTYSIVYPCYVSLVSETGFSHDNRMKFKYSLEMEEDL